MQGKQHSEHSENKDKKQDSKTKWKDFRAQKREKSS